VNEDEVVGLLESRGKTHLILTGRGAGKRLIELADLVTEMKKIKHPFDRGIKAVRGLDY
jgi:cob(I)alamin adenosyltransferase